MHCAGAAVIQAKATPYHGERFLHPISRGEHLTTLALSEPGTGAEFYFPQAELRVSIPAVDDPTSKSDGDPIVGRNSIAPSLPVPCKGRALVVDDNHVNRLIAAALLRELGVQVDVTCDGVEAVLALEQHTYDLVLMDLDMPKLDGFEATRQIRTLPSPKCHVPILAATASLENQRREDCIVAGMNGFVDKPLQREELSALLKKLRCA